MEPMSFLRKSPFIIIFLAMWLANSCAPKPKQAKTTLNITPSLAIADINMNGGAIVYGERTDGVGAFGKIFKPGQDVIIEMSFGIWNFSVIAYDGSNGPLTGAIECSLIDNVEISTESEVVDMRVDLAQCAKAGARRLDLNLCSTAQFSGVTAGTVANCNQTSVGIRSWRLRVLGHRVGSPNGEVVDGACIIESDYTGGSTNRRFPSGLGNTSIAPIEVIAYNSTDCSGTGRSFSFRENIANPSSANVKVFQNTNVLNMVVDLEALGFVLDRSPVLATIANQPSAVENTAITPIDANDSVTGNDTDEDGDAITYSCFYDNTIDGTVGTANTCTSLAGVTFTAANGVMSWTPSYAQSGNYEFRIIGDEGDLTGDTIFTINVANVDRAPIIAAIADETVSENTAITQVNASDANTAGDLDIDGDAITYTCQYDTVVNGAIAGGTNCTSLPGTASFDTATGILNWTPAYFASTTPTYEIEITATSGPDSLTDTELLVINVNNTDRAPVIAAISNQAIGENSAITQVNADDTSGGDTDVDGDALTYSCTYDMTVDTAVAAGTNCTTLTGVSFNTTTGVMDWTPSFDQSGNYEFKIVATGGPDTLSDDEIFAITVNNVDRAPVLAAIADETIEEGNTFTAVDANDTSGGDTDIDGDTITYTCLYDTVVDGAVGAGTNCTSLLGTPTFNTATGTLSWTPSLTAQGTYEIKITGSEGDLIDDEIFVWTVTDNTPVADGTLNGTNWALGAGPTHSKSLALGTWTPSTTSDLTSQKLYFYHKTGCTGTPIQTHTLGAATTDFTFHAPFGHTVYSYKLTGIDDNANESTGICSSDISVSQGFMGFSGNYTDGFIFGTHLYALKTHAVDVFDINTNAMVPSHVSSLQFRSPQSTLPHAEQLKKAILVGNYIYVIGIRSIGVFDINNLGTAATPIFIGRWDHNMIAVKDAVSTGTYLFMVDNNGILAWDISTPTSPSLLNGGSEYPTSDTNNISIDYLSSGNRLYTLGDGGVSSYDLTAFPASAPGFETTTPTGLTNASDIGIDNTNNLLYAVEDVAAGEIKRFDISSPPSILASGGKATHQQIKRIGNIDETNQRLFGCGDTANGAVTSIGTPTPGIESSLDSVLNVSCNTVVGNASHFYMLARTGIFAGDVTGPQDTVTPEPIGETASGFRDISISGNKAVVASLSDRVQLLDLTNIHSPKQIGVIDNAGTLVDKVELVGTTAFTLSGSLFASHDTTLLPSATETGSVTLSSPSQDTFVLDSTATPTHAFIAATNGIMTVAVGGMTEVNTITSVCVGDSVVNLAYKSGFLYATCGVSNNLEIYDASDPAGAGLSLVNTVTSFVGPPLGIALGTNHAYISMGSSGIAVVDITTPASASIVTASYNPADFNEGIQNLLIDGGVLYALGTSNIHSLNISSPTTPTHIYKHFGANGSTTKLRGALIPNSYLYISKKYDGIEVLNIEDPQYIHK